MNNVVLVLQLKLQAKTENVKDKQSGNVRSELSECGFLLFFQ